MRPKILIRTFTGILLDLNNPNPLHIELEDIANGLALNNRYHGQSKRAFPVIVHSMVVAAMLKSESPEVQYTALNHDDEEGYMLDLAGPAKHTVSLAGYRRIADGLMKVIAKRFGFEWPKQDVVKRMDTLVRKVEQGMIMRGHQFPTCFVAEEFGLPIKTWNSGNQYTTDVIADKIGSLIGLPNDELKKQFTEKFWDLHSVVFQPRRSIRVRLVSSGVSRLTLCCLPAVPLVPWLPWELLVIGLRFASPFPYHPFFFIRLRF